MLGQQLECQWFGCCTRSVAVVLSTNRPSNSAVVAVHADGIERTLIYIHRAGDESICPMLGERVKEEGSERDVLIA